MRRFIQLLAKIDSTRREANSTATHIIYTLRERVYNDLIESYVNYITVHQKEITDKADNKIYNYFDLPADPRHAHGGDVEKFDNEVIALGNAIRKALHYENYQKLTPDGKIEIQRLIRDQLLEASKEYDNECDIEFKTNERFSIFSIIRKDKGILVGSRRFGGFFEYHMRFPPGLFLDNDKLVDSIKLALRGTKYGYPSLVREANEAAASLPSEAKGPAAPPPPAKRPTATSLAIEMQEKSKGRPAAKHDTTPPPPPPAKRSGPS